MPPGWNSKRCRELRELLLSGFQKRQLYAISGDEYDNPLAGDAINKAQRDALSAGEFPPDVSGEAIHLTTSLAELHDLKRAFDENEREKAPTVNLHFNAKFSRTSIYRKNTPVHSTIAGSLAYQLRSRLSLSNNFDFVGDTAISNSLPIPDLFVSYTDWKAGVVYRPILALKVGFSESRESLESCVKALLTEVPDVGVVVLVDIKETPNYKNPLLKAVYSKISRDLLQQDPKLLLKQDVYLEDSSDKNSSLFRFGLRWVGRLRGSAQVWKRDPKSNKPISEEQVTFLGPNAEENPRLKLKLSDFVPSDIDKLKDDYAFDCSEWAMRLERARWFLARNRSGVAIGNLRKYNPN
ncbi:hypothetical protein AJ79_10179 [Helicocarpus griseus UAMH5409]|uniref:Uncharacterized protein n=1 Tax=Helicocarpus griseus UAMH5409 TaxID=1447875 RepID=A0A2B7WFD4_9EURO|nr:hypothetical protein AJ79_10179 [Helicocarpus griseus UAMH5409]